MQRLMDRYLCLYVPLFVCLSARLPGNSSSLILKCLANDRRYGLRRIFLFQRENIKLAYMKTMINRKI